MIDASFLKNMIRAADAGLDHFTTPEHWNGAIEMIANANREAGETIEQAYVRMIRSDKTCIALDKMRRAALRRSEIRKMGRPRKYQPQPASLSAAQNELARRSLDLAKAESISFERAFVKVIETPEGAVLFRETRK